jgi:hypothetical protein
MTRACPATRRAGEDPRSVLRILVRAESVMFMAIAVALVVIAVVVFARGEQFAVTITWAVNSALFIVVVLELVRTIVARLEGGGFQLQPFWSSGSSRRPGTSSR